MNRIEDMKELWGGSLIWEKWLLFIMDVTDLLVIEKELEKMNEKLQLLIDLEVTQNKILEKIYYMMR